MDCQDQPKWLERCKTVHLQAGGTIHLYKGKHESLVLCSRCVERGSPGAPLQVASTDRFDGKKAYVLMCPVQNCHRFVDVTCSELEMLGFKAC